MNFVYEPALQEYMRSKNKKIIVVEVAECNCTDLEVQELHVHFVDDKQAEYFKTKKKFRVRETEMGEVLLPPYRLEYNETVTFGLKKFLCFKYIRYEGIRF